MCPDCRDGLYHCHGTLLVDLPECTDPDCTDPSPLIHTLVIEVGRPIRRVAA
ncbi:hypothetical protein Acsp05_31440 [Actinokineospora sp. NBRC 105648]|nr:hypothetical protein Acsp05_31440 [Actinokineospora sp. NBRC 105648]